MVLERAGALTKQAADALALLALLGGTAPRALLTRLAPDAAVISELLAAGLVVRRAQGEGVAYALMVPELAADIASPLGSFELAERLAGCLLEQEAVSARLLLNVAGSAFPPPQRQALLERAVEVARRSGRAADEIEGLLALAASPALRSRELLLRLERLTRHAGSPHPQVLLWLNEAATREPDLLPLARRREAERAARSGDTTRALELLSEADAAARAQDDAAQLALCLATRGALALYRADTEEADRALRDAAARLALLDDVDPEERARLDHNLGVVSLYRDRLDDAVAAFEGSLELKRRLGDRAGVRSCLLNLGLALSRRGAHERAEQALDEAVALARSLGQEAGRAWCLAARADLEVRRGAAGAAERFVAEAAAIEQVPPLVTADLCILRGQVALLTGDGARAARAVQALDAALRQGDALLDAKATLVEAGAALASLPAEPRRAARLCVRVLRAARAKQLFELEPQARALLHGARARRTRAAQTRYPASMDGDAELWTLLERVVTAPTAEPAPLELLRLARKLSGAERALLALCDAAGSVPLAWGVDFDGFALPEAASRCEPAALEARTLTYRRDVETGAGRGSRLAIPRALEGGGRRRALARAALPGRSLRRLLGGARESSRHVGSARRAPVRSSRA
jgi:tetratricopeptide (TPR) repeat protein